VTKVGWGGKFRRSHNGSLAASRNSVLLGCLGAIAKFTIGIVAFISPAFAQSNIVPDNTLLSEASRVIFNFNGTPNEVIEGGAQRGQNLFHSFREFNVGENRGAYFLVFDTNIQNILARVTGSNRSDILGILGTRQVIDGNFFRSNANLFLMNPNGIVFGENARLDVGASFVATTANGVQFGNQGNFNTINPQTPGVLTVNPSALFFDAVARQGVITANQSLLGVAPGKNLALVGSDISLNGSTVRAFGGRVELGAIGGTGTVGINQDGNFNLPENLTRANVNIANSLIDVAADNGGSITINAGNLNISGSTIQAGIRSGLGTVDSQAGDITINTTGKLQIAPQSFIRNWVFPDAIGKGGDIRINTDSMSFTGFGSGYISASTWGKGDAGSVVVKANNDVALNGSTIFSIVETGAEGNAGNIDISTSNLLLTGGGQLSAATFGKGDAGDIVIEAQERVSVAGTSQNINIFSAVKSTVELGGQGNGGNIKVRAGSLSVTGGAQLQTGTRNQGNAGNILIDTRDFVLFDGTNSTGQIRSSAFSSIEKRAEGKGGNIEIKTGSLSVANGAQLVANNNDGKGDAGNVSINARDRVSVEGTSFDGRYRSSIFSIVTETGDGKGGNIDIATGSLAVTNGALISSSTVGKGDAGNVSIQASKDISVEGVSSYGNFRSGIFSIVDNTGNGKGGIIDISTDSLAIKNGGLISASTLGTGDAGNVSVNARDRISLEGTSNDGRFASAILSIVTETGNGKGGSLDIATGSLSMNGGGQISASSFGQGDTGNISINARDRISAIGTNVNGNLRSGIFNTVEGKAKGESNNIDIKADSLYITEGATVAAATLSEGRAGNITINSQDIFVDGTSVGGNFTSGIYSTVEFLANGQGGNIGITTNSLALTNGGVVTASTFGQGNAGSITINADDITLKGTTPNGIFSSGLASETGGINSSANAGNITLNTRLLNISDGALISTRTSNQGQGGDLNITARESINVAGTGTLSNGQSVRSSLITEAFGSGAAGNLKIFDTGLIKIEDGAGISASTFGQGRGGNIDVTADTVDLIGLSANGLLPSGLASETTGIGSSANAGNVRLTTRLLNIRDGALISTSTSNQGKGGNLNITARESINLIGAGTYSDGRVVGSRLFTSTSGLGSAGNIQIFDTGLIKIQDGGIVTASTFGQGRGGNIEVNADSLELEGVSSNGLSRSFLGSETAGISPNAKSGDVNLTTRILNIRDGALISTDASNQGQGGNLTVTARESLNVLGTSTIAKNSFQIFYRSALSTQTKGSGAAGNLNITDTGQILIADGAVISASTSGQGKGGNININADSFDLKGISTNGRYRSVLASETTGTDSNANAGDIKIITGILNVHDGALISTATSNQGRGGNLTISARESMNFIGTATLTNNRFIRSGLSVETSGSGSAGNLQIFDTGNIQIKDGALISTITSGQGNAGNIDISADSLEILGFSTDRQFRSALASETINQNSSANAGDITIKTRNLNIRDGALISTQTLNQGKGGNLTVTARESLNIFGIGTQNGRAFGSGLFTSTSGLGAAGNIKIFDTNRIVMGSGGQVSASSSGLGQGGNIEVNADTVDLIGVSNNNQVVSAFASETFGKGSIANAGDIKVTSRILSIRDGARISTQTFNQGRGGNLTINARESLNIVGTGTQNDQVVGSGLFTRTSNFGAAGNIKIFDTELVKIKDGGQISASTFGQGQGGDIQVNADTLEILGISSNGQFVSAIGSETTGANSSADAGDVTLTARNLNIRDRGLISTRSFNQGKAGNININVDKTLNLTNGNILTFSRQSSGGSVNVNAEDIRLFGDSNISTSVVSGAGGGGDIKLTADSILAFDDSDIFAFAQDGKGGNITFDTPAFFGENYRPATPGTNPLTLEENNRVDINASGAVSGVIVLPDTSSIQNNLSKLPQNAIDTNALIANSCIARRNQQQNGSFFITGSGGVPVRPGDTPLPSYSTGDVQPVPSEIESTKLPSSTPTKRRWQLGDPVVEPSGVYELPNGKLVLGKEC
jgi:filamentous hemagglutinin family protein